MSEFCESPSKDSPYAPASPLKLALISPKGPLYRHRGGIFGKSLRYMPLTLPTLAALIPKEIPHQLTCIDEGIADVDPDLDAHLVGLTVITGTATRAYQLAADFRRRGMTVVLGGPHVTLLPEEARRHADSIVVGYAEQTWPQLLREFVRGKMRPRYDQATDLDLAHAPLPDRTVLPRRSFLTANVFEATRGCVHNCSFCVVPPAWGRRPLQKPIERVVQDIKRQRARRAIFVDLNLIANRQYAAELFKALIPLQIQWFGLATTLLCKDLALLDLAAASGCGGLLMGFESIGSNSLKSTQKSFNKPEEYARVTEELHRRKIALQGCFVFGFDEDTPEVFEKTAEFAVECGIDLPRFAILTPFPGTKLFKDLDTEGRLLTKNWELYDGQHVVFQPRTMTAKQLQQGTEAAWKRAYSYKSIFRRLRHTPARSPLTLLTNLGYRRYAHGLHKFYNCDWMLDIKPANPRDKHYRPRRQVSLP